MSDALTELFMPGAMAPLVRRFAEQSEERSFIDIYQSGEKIEANVDGTYKWEELRYSRDLAPIAGMDAPSTSGTKLMPIPRSGNVFAIKQHVDLPARFLEGWRAPGSVMPNAAEQLASNLQNLTNRFMRTLNYVAAKSVLTTDGVVDLAAVPNSTLAAGSASRTYPVQALSASTTWATDSTKIRSAEINRLRKTYRQGAGFRPGRAIASSTIEGNLTQNVEIKSFILEQSIASRILERSFEERGIGDAVRLGNLDWFFADDYYAADATADTPAEVNSDLTKFCVLPPVQRSQECFGLVEGWQFVPNGPIAGPVQGAPGNLFTKVKGFGAYVTLETAPVGIRLHVFWCGDLVQKMPKAVMVFDSVP